MGRPKAWLDFHGEPLLARIVRRLRGLSDEFVVVASPGQEVPETGALVVHDEAPGQGPVAGMVAGLRVVRAPLALVLACDAPFVDPVVAKYLAEAAAAYDVVVPRWEERLHPLHAVYRTAVQPQLAAVFREGGRRPGDVYALVRTRVVGEEELQALDPEGLSFLNVNRPEDYRAALATIERQGDAT